LPDELRDRYNELTTRREQEALTPDDHQELLRLTDEVERVEVDRLAALAELARVRCVPLPALMDDLGNPTLSDG
jgi:hypothetical protein